MTIKVIYASQRRSVEARKKQVGSFLSGVASLCVLLIDVAGQKRFLFSISKTLFGRAGLGHAVESVDDLVDDIDGRFHAHGDGLDSGLDDCDFSDNFHDLDFDRPQAVLNDDDVLVASLADDFAASSWCWCWALLGCWSCRST
jgi:hypothetical protein